MKSSRLFVYIFFAIILLGFTSTSFSQTVTFCESVDDNGNPSGTSTVFNVHSDGGYLYVLVKGISNTKHVTYVIFYNDKFSTVLSQDTQTNWTYCWKKITFYDAGEYSVKVYDGSDKYMATGYLTIKYY